MAVEQVKTGIEDVPILFEDDYLLAVNKPAGLLIHANPSDSEKLNPPPNLEDFVKAEIAKSATLLHRLDRETSGLVLFAKRRESAAAMTQAFERRLIRKAYLAVVDGRWRNEWNRVESFLERGPEGRMLSRSEGPGKKALTTFRLLKAHDECSWIEAILKTGRTHQIRVHCASLGCPIVGDRIYGKASAALSEAGRQLESSVGQALHAYRVDFQHPITKAQLRLHAPLASVWSTYLKRFEAEPLLQKLFPEGDRST